MMFHLGGDELNNKEINVIQRKVLINGDIPGLLHLTKKLCGEQNQNWYGQ
jgi:hypothetical protein